ncbi:MAG: DUF4252 domain-containing protein [Muribaculaceae bacterium]|nr:DUF4252 domain-containing protein [Muribaculaceae bacterium]
MKTIYRNLIIIVVAIFATNFTANAQSLSLEKASNIKGVTSVYISKMMLSQIGESKLVGGVNIEDIASYLNSVEIVIAEDKNCAKELRQETNKLSKLPGVELLTKIKDDDENVTIYGKMKGNIYEAVLLIVDDGEDLIVILITGNIPLDKIAELTK